MKIVNESYYDEKLYREFNEMHYSQSKFKKALYNFWLNFLKVVLSILVVICTLLLRMCEFCFGCSLIMNDTKMMGEILVLWGESGIYTLFVVIFVFYVTAIFSYKFYKEKLCICRFEDGAIIEDTIIKGKSKTKKWSYTKVKKVLESDDLMVIYITPISGVLLKKDGFTEGDPEALKEFLKTKVPMLKVIEIQLKEE